MARWIAAGVILTVGVPVCIYCGRSGEPPATALLLLLLAPMLAIGVIVSVTLLLFEKWIRVALWLVLGISLAGSAAGYWMDRAFGFWAVSHTLMSIACAIVSASELKRILREGKPRPIARSLVNS